MNIQARIKIERQLIRHMIRVLKRGGWEVSSVDDGEMKIETATERDAMDAIFSVDESRIYFSNGSAVHGVFIVLGNDGWDAIAGYSYAENGADTFEALMETVFEYANYLQDENP